MQLYAKNGNGWVFWVSNFGHLIMDPLTGLHVDTDSPPSISTVHRWITTIVQTQRSHSTPKPFALFPVVIRPAGVLLYNLQQSGSALSRESQESISPGHYGIYKQGRDHHIPNYVWHAQNDSRWLAAERELYLPFTTFICRLWFLF